MDGNKQRLLVEYLISSTDLFVLCQHIIKPTYFDADLQNPVRFILDYYQQYNSVPTPDIIKVETGITLQTQKNITASQLEYTSKEIETFCKRRALEKAIMKGVDLLNKKDDFGAIESLIKEAQLVSLHTDLGLHYFETIEQRLERLSEDNPVTSTGWKSVDDKLFGGIARKEMILFAGNSGAGKSITLSNLGMNFIKQNLDVLYVSLELSEDIVGQRFDTMITGISRREWKTRQSEIITQVKEFGKNKGRMQIVRLDSGTTTNQIEAYLKQYYLHNDKMPDMLIVDYLDKMNANEYVSPSDVYTKDKLCAEQLRDLGERYNMFIATASQLNRSAVKAEDHDHSQIAGGISKINETDVYISLKASDVLKAQGIIGFVFQKTRNSDGVGSEVFLKWNSKNLNITDATDEPLTIKTKKDTVVESSNNDALRQLMLNNIS